jgi:sulfite dehydrogenase (quinone) subunit SoeC
MLASGLPALVMVLPLGLTGVALAAVLHLAGAFAARWLFFAEAEHVVGLYYGARG